MKNIILFLLLGLSLSSCFKKNDNENLVASYKTQEVRTDDFVKQIFTIGFSLYGKDFLTKIHDVVFLDKIKLKALEHSVEMLFVNHIASQNNIVIKDEELKTWIEGRTKGVDENELNYFLKLSYISKKEWQSLFKDQLLQNKVYQLLTTNKASSKKPKFKKEKHYQIGVIKFETKLSAEKAYKEIRMNPKKFDVFLNELQNVKSYSWLTEKEIPFIKKVLALKQGSISKPFETDWGHTIVKLKRVKDRNVGQKNNASGHILNFYNKSLIAFKKDPDLVINSQKVYGLKLKTKL